MISIETPCEYWENTTNWWYFLEIVILMKPLKGKMNKATIIQIQTYTKYYKNDKKNRKKKKQNES